MIQTSTMGVPHAAEATGLPEDQVADLCWLNADQAGAVGVDGDFVGASNDLMEGRERRPGCRPADHF